MFYLVRTIKEINDHMINTDFVVKTNQEEFIKSLMSEYKVIVVSITTVSGRPLSANFFGLRDYNDTHTQFCFKAENIQEAISRNITLELPLYYITGKENKLSIPDAQSLIEQEQSKIYKLKEDEEIKTEERRGKEKEIMDDKRKKKIIQVITETLEEINRIESMNIQNTELLPSLRSLHSLKEQLTKIKMGSNLEKATTFLEQTFSILEEIELSLVNTMKTQEEQITTDSSISNVDIINELDKIKRANQVNEAGTKQHTSDIYYGYLGIVGLYQKFIAKDIIQKFSKINNIISNSIGYIDFAILIITLTIGSHIAILVTKSDLNPIILQYLLIMGILGIARELPTSMKKASLLLTTIYIILAIIITFIIQKVLIINLALV